MQSSKLSLTVDVSVGRYPLIIGWLSNGEDTLKLQPIGSNRYIVPDTDPFVFPCPGHHWQTWEEVEERLKND